MFLFTEDCRIGIEQIDSEHEHLFEIINHAYALMNDENKQDKDPEIRELLLNLNEYADTHFEHEEAYMRKTNDPEYEMQRKQHAAFKEKIAEFCLEDLNSNQKETLDRILTFMTRWLYNHILSSDMMIGKMQPAEEWKESTNPCKFTSKYYTGIQAVDEEHARLFAIIGEVNELVTNEFIPDKYDNIVELLEGLKDYTETHFDNEEQYMERIQYQGLDAQKRAHTGFIEKLGDIEFEGFDGNQQEVLIELMDFLFHWLAQHILIMDKQIPVVS